MATTPSKELYSKEVTTRLLADYASGISINDLAIKFNKTSRSIISKLAVEKVYTKEIVASVNKVAGLATPKAQHVATIAAFLGLDIAKIASLENANKSALMAVELALTKLGHEYDEAK